VKPVRLILFQGVDEPMGYVTREMIDRAKKMDLLTYLQTYEPQELVHFGGNTYCTREHDSLKISNGASGKAG
jgi:hypothetical protein